LWCSYLFIYLLFLYFFLILSREILLGSDTAFVFFFFVKYQKNGAYNRLRDKIIYLISLEKTKLQEKGKKSLVYLDYQMWVFFTLLISISGAFFRVLCFSLINQYTRKLSTSRNRKLGQINNTCRTDFYFLRKLVFIAGGYKRTVAN